MFALEHWAQIMVGHLMGVHGKRDRNYYCGRLGFCFNASTKSGHKNELCHATRSFWVKQNRKKNDEEDILCDAAALRHFQKVSFRLSRTAVNGNYLGKPSQHGFCETHRFRYSVCILNGPKSMFWMRFWAGIGFLAVRCGCAVTHCVSTPIHEWRTGQRCENFRNDHTGN